MGTGASEDAMDRRASFLMVVRVMADGAKGVTLAELIANVLLGNWQSEAHTVAGDVFQYWKGPIGENYWLTTSRTRTRPSSNRAGLGGYSPFFS